MKKKSFGSELRALRKSAGRSMTEVACAIGKSIVYYSHVEGDLRAPFNPANVDFEKLAAVLGTSAESLADLATRYRRSVELRIANQTPGAGEIGLQLARMFSEGLSEEDVAKFKQLIEDRRKGNA